jgi:hypothetical protein
VARKERYIVGLDVGTSSVCCVVGEALDDGTLEVVGIGVAESRGIRRGVVVNLEAAVATPGLLRGWPQQCLYFCPLPQGQGSLRPTLGSWRR